jgi:hypothetical protein
MRRRHDQRRLIREVERLRVLMRDAQAAGDLDSEYLLLCLIETRMSELSSFDSF